MAVAGQYFSVRRSVELSVIDYITTQINASWSNVTVVKSFNQAYDTTRNLPIVAVYLDDVINDRREVGNTALDPTYSIAIDVFAESDGQRLDLSAFIVDKLKDGCVYYTFSQQSGSPQTLNKVAAGRLYVFRFLNDSAVRLTEANLDVKDRFRQSIIIDVKKS